MASGRQFNIRNVTFTPTGGGSMITFNGVTSVNIDGGGSIAKFAGDGDHYTTTAINDFYDPAVTIVCANVSQLPQVGQRGTFTVTYKDARAANTTTSASGDATYTITTAIIQNESFSGSFRQFLQNTVVIATESSDGITSPISVVLTP